MDLLIYLAKASLLLTLFWVVYKVFLEAETYHRFKRIYLHVGYLLSLMLPLFTYTKIEEITFSPVSYLAPSSSEFVPTEITPSTFELVWSFITENAVIELIYISISLLFLVHLLVKFFRLLKFLKASKAFKTDGIFHIEQPISEGAFSFLNYIVYDPKLYSEAELKIILAHEKAHVAHKHSLDILFAHLYKCAFWFNPFAWLYQKSLVLNLEYEADAKVVAKTTKRDYQLILYSITQQQFKSQLQHSFHQSPIKKRIAMLNKNKHNRSFWKLFIVSPMLVVFFLLFQVETKAQIKEAVTTTVAKVNRIEITFDENTTKEDLDSTVEFLKEDFNIDMSYSNLEFDTNGQLKSIALEVDSNDGFNGSVTSPDVARLPVYFYRDYTEGVESPFGVGIKPESDTTSKPDYNTIKDAENFIINGNQIDKEELAKTYIPVETYSYDKKSKTLSITTRPEFSNPYFSKISAITEELVDKFGKNITEKMTFINVSSDYEPILITLDKFKISENKEIPLEDNEAKEKPEDSKRDYKNAENFVINGKKINKEKLVENYIPVEDYSYDANSKTLSIKNSSAFSEPYYSQFLDLMKDLKIKNDDYFLKALTYFKLTPDYKVVTMQVTDFKTSETQSDALIDKDISLSNGAGKTERKFLDFNSKYQNQDMVMFVDGVKVEKGKTANIDTDQIESVEILKSPEELKAEGYNSNFVKGVIKITTKKGNASNASKNKDSKKVNRLALNNSDNAIYLVDGKETDKDQLNQIKPEEIKSIDVVKSAKDIKTAGYDPKKVDGLIKIKTKKDNDINASQYANSDELYKSALGRNDNTIIYKVDGEVVNYKKFAGLDPEQIQSMVVVKSPYGLKEAGYDPKKVDGIIIISTKKKDTNAKALYEKHVSDLNLNGTLIYLVDGEEVSQDEFKKIKPNQIESLDVLKNASGIKDFGYDPNKIDGLMNLKTKSKNSKATGKIKIK
ncbi:M56 family metallopeptidase [Psychroflexus montanilacus]|uniref:M56 family metallopeptidase n=1 Tax=Psychroflexus montanilacus TaxID=2873598 RepID=UPI001CCE04D2|nr:M56 family metallopeptidase [Psychroflexus montanilacus]MBZ9652890.1 M56 family metallopeptidase [Psychroflexus montanilacus]